MKKTNIRNFSEAEQYLNDMPRFTSKHTIKETREFLEKLGNPDLSMKIIHVAGTNGKGSTCAYLDSVLREAGISTGLFTSPHLVDISERFRINGKQISHDEFYDAFRDIFNRLEWENPDPEDFYHPTYFEFLFFMAMLIFKKAGIEWCILETGLGGLLDATNSVKTKEAAVITRIDLDHTEYLGNTKAEIAVQKAGIIAKGKPVVYGDYVPEASEAILREANRIQSGKLYPVGEQNIKVLLISPENIDFSLADGYYKNVSICLDTNAVYQLENAALAVKAVEAAGLTERITPDTLKRGMNKCRWAGRMEEVLPDVFVDGAHNPDGIRAFIETVKRDGCDGVKPRKLLFGVVSDKDHTGMVREIAESGLFSEIVITRLKTGRGADPAILTNDFKDEAGVKISVSGSADEAFEKMLGDKRAARETHEGDFRVYVAGSLYLVGEIKGKIKNDKL